MSILLRPFEGSAGENAEAAAMAPTIKVVRSIEWDTFFLVLLVVLYPDLLQVTKKN